jgi:hypothetical protein
MSSKRKKYEVDDRAEKATHFFVACQPDSATNVKMMEAMRVRGYSNHEAANLTLQMQVLCAIQRKKGEVSLRPEAAATHSLLTLATAATAARPALRNIMPNQAAVPVLQWMGLLPVNSHYRRGRCGKRCTKNKLDKDEDALSSADQV